MNAKDAVEFLANLPPPTPMSITEILSLANNHPHCCLIWSIEHNAWWRPNCHGYTTVKANAGRYTMPKAIEIIAHAHVGWDPNKPPRDAIVVERTDQPASLAGAARQDQPIPST